MLILTFYEVVKTRQSVIPTNGAQKRARTKMAVMIDQGTSSRQEGI